MPAGRPKLPTELKKMKGTLNVTREKENPGSDVTLKTTTLILDANSVSCPKTIKDKYCRKYWKNLTNGLLAIGVLSAADIPELEQLCLCLQKLREVQDIFIKTSVLDDNYDQVQNRWIRLSDKFEKLGAKYYISPVVRSKIRLEDLNIKKTEQEIVKNDNAIGNLLQGRK